MPLLEARLRQRIEACLGRPLTQDEQAADAALADLAPPVLAVARALAATDLPLCLQYLLAVAASASARDVLLFTHHW
jgi:hypothetical protein